MLSTKDLSSMLEIEQLRSVCRGIAALEIIMTKETDLRYYSYHPCWSESEEVFEMTNGSEQHMLILFHPEGCVISGIDEERYDWENDLPNREAVTLGLPEVFSEFMYDEPIKTMKSTFCIWKLHGTEWERGQIMEGSQPDGSENMLQLLDGNPQKYVDFCQWYYETNIPVDIVKIIYNGEAITPEMIKKLNEKRTDLHLMRKELCQMGYPNTL